jgi:hypothetical protein
MRILEQYKYIHKNVIKYLIACERDITTEPISKIFEFPYFVDF